MRSQLEAVIFRPYWNVPASIERDELLPGIMRDPSWIRANDYELVTPQGGVVERRAVSEQTLAELRTGELLLRQRPGPKNMLGLVKFLFPNQYDVYMHGTPAWWLFDRARRDFSHGCIRVEKAGSPGGVGSAQAARLVAGSHRRSDARDRTGLRKG